jgi:hypothetical protein
MADILQLLTINAARDRVFETMATPQAWIAGGPS